VRALLPGSVDGTLSDIVDAVPAPESAEALRPTRHLEALCSVVPDRRPGSVGNDEAVALAAKAMEGSGWAVELQDFDCLDWETDGGKLTIDGATIDLTPGPYGLGVEATGPVRVLRTLQDLEQATLAGSIAVLAGDLASEPLTPKAFPFYGSDEHAEIIRLLEAGAPLAVVAVTGKYPELCGAIDPFPLIEDGDFEIPAASVRPDDAGPLLDGEGEIATVEIRSRRIPSRARNVVASRGPQSPRLTVIAHIDTKPGTPGAVDNATGVVVQLLLAELLDPARHPDLPIGVELLAVNGEDHYAAPGELAWLASNGDARPRFRPTTSMARPPNTCEESSKPGMTSFMDPTGIRAIMRSLPCGVGRPWRSPPNMFNRCSASCSTLQPTPPTRSISIWWPVSLRHSKS
jgi:hypothetical protein